MGIYGTRGGFDGSGGYDNRGNTGLENRMALVRPMTLSLRLKRILVILVSMRLWVDLFSIAGIIP
ncbi:hypothetical protein KUH03_16515 [Sphingobacterium sp. E70]|uniref:hypothetical protein n=1 Tax=Sphingobacterium sp. E70 TaxID=2853439 RepID=UPI00211BBBE4|nr:hypothetical protein [Sphingobacterium sp. E70]ULT28058.1 hypothetical protein KUH03_16515 [Sphingobacterium sp. E70]